MSSKKKIVYVVTKGDKGGAQKYVEDLVNNIDKDKFEVVVVSGRDGSGLKRDKSLVWLDGAYRPYFLFINDLMAVIELWLYFRKERPEVVHLNSSKAGVIGTIAAKLAGGSKVVFTAHGWVFSDDKLSKIRRFFYKSLHKLAGYGQEAVITVSQFDYDLASREGVIPKEKMTVIGNGIDINSFLDDLMTREEAREEIKKRIEKEGVNFQYWIGSVGRLVKEKNYSLMIEIARGVIRERGEVGFFIIGDGEERGKLEKQIKEGGMGERFYIVPSLGGDASLMKAFDVFMLTSRKEGLPYTLIEAVMAKRPVLSTRVGGMTEIVTTIGEEFMLEGDMIGKVEEVLDNLELAQEKIVRFFLKNRDKFELESRIKKIEEIYLN